MPGLLAFLRRLDKCFESHISERSGLNHQPSSRRAGDALSMALEPLESRTLLSAWPPAGFVRAHLEDTIYVNQLGNATLPGKLIGKPGQSHGYALFFDDGGYIKHLAAKGTANTQMAFYGAGRNPTLVNASTGKNGYASIKRIPIGPEKRMLWLSVKATDPLVVLTYDLVVQGVRHNIIYSVDVSPNDDSGHNGTDISGEGDADFYRFTTTRAGDWKVTVSPDKQLDATIVVFDSAGNPLGGSFTSAIDQGEKGRPETWLGRNLPAGATYYVRVDGKGPSTGDFDISVQRYVTPQLSVSANDPTASENPLDTAQFTITRSATAQQNLPLKVRFHLTGTAQMGSDFVPISRLVTIPANRNSATVTIIPIADRFNEPVRTVVLTLAASDAYLISNASAQVSIADKP